MNEIASPLADDVHPAAIHGVVALIGARADADSNWGMLRIHGADATGFLHKQLTQDVQHLSGETARVAAWCTAKGRMVASFVLVREQPSDDETASYLLLCRRDVMPQFIQKLKMYVLRSKVTLEDVGASMAAYGLLGEAAHSLWLSHGGSPAPIPWQGLNTGQNAHDRYLVNLYPAAAAPDAAVVPRVLCLQASALPEPEGALLDLQHWEWAEAASGVASIERACSELFIPQMVNFESVGGVNFKKGCYPGQEVVARSQFRGAIKRRGQLATLRAAIAPQAGAEIWFRPAAASAENDAATEPCGTVVQAATQGVHSMVFASLQNQAVDAVRTGQGSLHLASDSGPELTLLPLPYPLIEV